MSGIQEVIDLLGELSEHKGLKVAVSESAKGGVITGAAATTGGLLLGPLGLILGGLVGGLTAFAVCNEYDSVPTVLMNLTPQEKARLYSKVKAAVTYLYPHVGYTLAGFLLTNHRAQEVAINALRNFLITEKNLSLQ